MEKRREYYTETFYYHADSLRRNVTKRRRRTPSTRGIPILEVEDEHDESHHASEEEFVEELVLPSSTPVSQVPLNPAAPTFTIPEATHLIAPPTENEAADVAPMPEMQDVHEVESTTQPEATERRRDKQDRAEQLLSTRSGRTSKPPVHFGVDLAWTRKAPALPSLANQNNRIVIQNVLQRCLKKKTKTNRLDTESYLTILIVVNF